MEIRLTSPPLLQVARVQYTVGHHYALYFYSTPFVLLEGVHRDIDGEKGEDGEAPSRVYKGGMGLEPSLYPTWSQSIGTLRDRGTGAKTYTGIGSRRHDLANPGRVSQVLPRAPGDRTWLTDASVSSR